MIQEFQISVTPLDNNEYLVRTENVAQGVPQAEEQVHWETDEWWKQTQQLMNDPLISLLEDDSSLEDDLDDLLLMLDPSQENDPDSGCQNLVSLGRKLYDALFQGSLRDSFVAAQGIAKHQGSVLRLRLGLKDIFTARLPWEVLNAGGKGNNGTPLATGIDVVFSRYQPNIRQNNPGLTSFSNYNQPLKILMAIAAPNDQESLALKQEALHLLEELSQNSPNNPKQIELTILEQPGREQLTQALEQGKYQVFHYAGHSNFEACGGNIYLVNSNTGLTEKVSGEDLAGLLVNNGVQLAVFNSCRGANAMFADDEEDLQGGSLAQALVRRGVPAVLAMAERIPDEVALTLTRLLYRNINQGQPIDISLNRARQGLLSAYGSHQLYWALPVLYLHPKFDGVLINPNDAQNVSYIKNVLNKYTTQEVLSMPMADSPEDWQDSGEEGNSHEEDQTAAFISSVLAEYNNSSTSATSVSTLRGPEDEQLPPQIDEENDEQTAAFIRDIFQEFAESEEGDLVTARNSHPHVTTAQLESPDEEDLTSNSRASNVIASSPNKEVNSPSSQSRSKTSLPKWVWLLGITGILTIVAIFGWWFSNRNANSLTSNQQIPSLSSPTDTNKNNFSKLATADLTRSASEKLSQGDLATGANMVEILLDRGALPMAKTALESVATENSDNPKIIFLRGRLAWQSVLAGNSDFSLDDARRYWETAVKQDKKSLVFLNALGFAYYGEKDFNRANQTWYDAIDLAAQEQVSMDDEMINTYAGLALGLAKLAQNQSGEQQTILNHQAIKLRQKVFSAAPEQFQPNSLGNNWLWTPQAIKDWQDLMQLQEGN